MPLKSLQLTAIAGGNKERRTKKKEQGTGRNAA
jgi:hypothetical protein